MLALTRAELEMHNDIKRQAKATERLAEAAERIANALEELVANK